MTRTHKIAALAAAAFLATGSYAAAQLPTNPDGSPPQDQPSHLTTASCGAVVNSIVRTQSAPSTITSTTFTQLAGANVAISVPAGGSRCVKVLFTGESACGPSMAADYCYVRALDNNTELDPQGGGFQAFDSEDQTASAHAYEWIGRLGEGVHNIRLERRVGAPATPFTLDDWTFDVEVSV
jgi:hypothetical protein